MSVLTPKKQLKAMGYKYVRGSYCSWCHGTIQWMKNGSDKYLAVDEYTGTLHSQTCDGERPKRPTQ